MRFPSFDFDQASADLFNFYADQADLGNDIDNYFDVACKWLDSVIREEGRIQPAQLQALLRNHSYKLHNVGHVRIKTDVDGSFVSQSLGVRFSDSLDDFSDIALEEYPIHLSFLGHNQVFRPFVSPTWLGSLIAQLASSISPESVLDPVSGMGMLLHAINEEAHPAELYGITGAKELVPYAKALLSNGNAVLFERMPAEISKRKYSLIVADPPVYRWSLDRRGFAKSQLASPVLV